MTLPPSSAPRASASRSGSAPAQPVDQQLRRAVRRQGRDRVGERGERAPPRVAERVERAGRELVCGLGGRQRRVVDHDRRAHAGRVRRGAAGLTVNPGHLGGRERRRDRRGRARGARGDQRLAHVDHPAAAEGDDQLAGDRAQQVAGDLVDEAGRHLVHRRRGRDDGGRAWRRHAASSAAHSRQPRISGTSGRPPRPKRISRSPSCQRKSRSPIGRALYAAPPPGRACARFPRGA